MGFKMPKIYSVTEYKEGLKNSFVFEEGDVASFADSHRDLRLPLFIQYTTYLGPDEVKAPGKWIPFYAERYEKRIHLRRNGNINFGLLNDAERECTFLSLGEQRNIIKAIVNDQGTARPFPVADLAGIFCGDNYFQNAIYMNSLEDLKLFCAAYFLNAKTNCKKLGLPDYIMEHVFEVVSTKWIEAQSENACGKLQTFRQNDPYFQDLLQRKAALEKELAMINNTIIGAGKKISDDYWDDIRNLRQGQLDKIVEKYIVHNF